MKDTNMIYTITLSPALDLSGTVKEVIPNEKNYVHDEMRIAGGNGINAARIIHRLNKKVICTGFLGGPTGEEIKNLLNQENLKHSFIQIDNNTRINITVSNQKSHDQTRLSFPGPQIKHKDMKFLESFVNKVTKKSLFLIGGSLPPGVTTKKLNNLIQSIKKAGHLCLVDCPGPVLSDVIKANPFFIKPNLTEFQLMTGTKVKTLNSVLKLAKKLTKDIPLICVSSVEGGALLVTQNAAWFGKIPPIKVQSTVGAGDSMVGGISSELSQYISHKNFNELLSEKGEHLLRLGLACSAATLSVRGITQGSKKDILDFYLKIKINRIN